MTDQRLPADLNVGRTPHIHMKVHVGGSVVHTGQLFFRDAVSDAIYRTSAYSARAARHDQRPGFNLRPGRRQPSAGAPRQAQPGRLLRTGDRRRRGLSWALRLRLEGFENARQLAHELAGV